MVVGNPTRLAIKGCIVEHAVLTAGARVPTRLLAYGTKFNDVIWLAWASNLDRARGRRRPQLSLREERRPMDLFNLSKCPAISY